MSVTDPQMCSNECVPVHPTDSTRVLFSYGDRCELRTHVFTSSPPPPAELWDSDDEYFLDTVICKARVRLLNVDPKNGRYEGRFKFYWSLRTKHSNERTEPRFRVPGVRAPSLVCSVHESRIWREAMKDTSKTICWKGTSDISIAGFEIFEVHDFPFDRQFINLGLFEFVWRSSQDTSCYHETMKIVHLSVVTNTSLPEWDPFSAVVIGDEIKDFSAGPSHASRFALKLRIQRKPFYYIWHILFVSFLILLVAILPLGLRPGPDMVGTRLSLHGAGMLTLVAFKYGVSRDMPSVPYSTLTTSYMNAVLISIGGVSLEALLAYRLVERGCDETLIHNVEDSLLACLSVGWLSYFVYCACFMKSRPWEDVMRDQMVAKEAMDETEDGHAVRGPIIPFRGLLMKSGGVSPLTTFAHLSRTTSRNMQTTASDYNEVISSRP